MFAYFSFLLPLISSFPPLPSPPLPPLISFPPLSFSSSPPISSSSSPRLPLSHLLFLEVSEVVHIGGTKELNDGRLLWGENNAVSVHPSEHACSHKGGHVGEVQLQCGGERFILWVPVPAASSQDKPMACHLAVSQCDWNVTVWTSDCKLSNFMWKSTFIRDGHLTSLILKFHNNQLYVHKNNKQTNTTHNRVKPGELFYTDWAAFTTSLPQPGYILGYI